MADTIMTQTASAEQVRAQFSYDPETGALWFKHRDGAPDWWNARYPGTLAGKSASNGYIYVSARLRAGRTSELAHRIAWAVHYGAWPAGVVDHINGRRNDNRITNLRVVTKAENCFHRLGPPRASSGVRGVKRAGNAWEAHIGRKYLGRFASLDDAALAREAAEKERAIATVDEHRRLRY